MGLHHFTQHQNMSHCLFKGNLQLDPEILKHFWPISNLPYLTSLLKKL